MTIEALPPPGQLDDSQLTPQEMWDKLDRTADTEAQWLDGKASYLRQRMTGENDIQGRIGSGVQYVVYAVTDSRVFKVPQTRMSARNKYVLQGGDDAEVDRILELREEGAQYVEELLNTHPEAAPLFGNPKFNGEHGSAGAIEQDTLTIPDVRVFASLTPESQLNYVAQYIKLLKRMWAFGCVDRTFNFQVNTGTNQEGQVTLADFGEMAITKDRALEAITGRRWERAWGLKSLAPEVQAVALSMFDAELTESSLDRRWGSSL